MPAVLPSASTLALRCAATAACDSKRKGEQLVSEGWEDEESELEPDDDSEPDLVDDLDLDSWDDDVEGDDL